MWKNDLGPEGLCAWPSHILYKYFFGYAARENVTT
jgi:hypothetical protein